MRTYRLQRQGRAWYLCIPSHFFSGGIKKGAEISLELLEKGAGYSIIKLVEVKLVGDGEHSQGDKTSGKDS